MATLPNAIDVPLMEGVRLEMYRTFKDHDHYYELSQVLNGHASVLSKNANIIHATGPAIDAIEQDRKRGRRWYILLHTIPRSLMESVIQGTVAYDLLQAAPPETYKADGPGTYVAGIAIRQWQGKFLNIGGL